jgi:DivIVA domain-containing protein
VSGVEVAREIANVQFRPRRIRPGYLMGEVDEFLDVLEKAALQGDDLTELIRGAGFTLASWREVYDHEEVDAFLLRLAGLSADEVGRG